MELEAAVAELERRCRKLSRHAASQCRDAALGAIQEAAVYGNLRSAGLRRAFDFGTGKVLEGAIGKALDDFKAIFGFAVALPVEDRKRLVRCLAQQLTVIFVSVIEARDDEINGANLHDDGTQSSLANFIFSRESFECLKRARQMLEIGGQPQSPTSS